ncbi:peptidylprolyl isomerase [Candidatus Poribacteria bacterium]|nr:peptidylprolyl isomerase [Candidatus Poribacteria bacterium]
MSSLISDWRQSQNMLSRKRVNQFPIALVVLLCLSLIFFLSCSQPDKQSSEPVTEEAAQPETQQTVIKPAEEPEEPERQTFPDIDPANAIAVIQTEKGTIEFEFYASDAPVASKNFIKNANSANYRNEHFHDVQELFIQAGSRLANDTIPIEKSEHPLVKGVVLLAKTPGETVSDGDEFFICKDAIELDEDYTILGKVISGLEVLDNIAKYDKIVDITIRERDEE